MFIDNKVGIILTLALIYFIIYEYNWRSSLEMWIYFSEVTLILFLMEIVIVLQRLMQM